MMTEVIASEEMAGKECRKHGTRVFRFSRTVKVKISHAVWLITANISAQLAIFSLTGPINAFFFILGYPLAS
jgi:hypothetical protein